MKNFTYLQKYAYNVLCAGYNVFLTGGAGTGKSYVIKKFIDTSRAKGLNVLVSAPTGIAAFNIDGVTTHRAFDAPIGPLTFTNNNFDAEDTIVESDIIIIDEISMCRIDLFDFIVNKILQANNRRKRFGKACIQLVVVGDFLQLPPVTLGYEKIALDRFYSRDIGNGFAFDSKYWNMFEFKNIILTEVVRQDNLEFIESLNKARVGNKTVIEYIYNNSNKNELSDAITICGKNDEATEKNKEALDKIQSCEILYEAIVDGEATDADFIAERVLKLKIGAKVMTLVNDKDYAFNNGSFGTVMILGDKTITVKMDNGAVVNLERYEWKVYNYDLETTEDNKIKLIKHEVGSITQFPLKLAYAITIHKSQGQTYGAVNLSPYCWDCGQLYVALSRVKSIDKLHFNYAPDNRYLVISLNVIKFYNSIVADANKTIDTSVNILEQNQKKVFNDDEEKLLDLLKGI